MKEHNIKFAAIPTTAEVEAERERLAYRSRYARVLRSTIYALLVVAAVAVLLATLFLPVLQVSGDSMNPTLQDRDIIVLVKTDHMKTGDLCGFYWQNKLLLKRIIGLPGDIITLDEDGAVTVNGEVLDEPLTAEINGHTVSVKALLRDKNTLRVLYDVDHAQGLEPWDLVWSTANFTFIPTEESALDKRMYTVTNFGTGLCGGYAVGSFETRNATSESGILSCFVDIPLHSNPAKMRTLWIGDLNNYDAKASLKVELPDAAQPITIAADTSIAMKGGPWFHYDLTDEERKAFPDGTFNITAIRIEPLAVSIVGSDYESEPRNLSRYNVQGRVKLYRADGSEITYGWDGNFFQGQYSPTVLRVDSYDILDPEAVAWVEIDGERFEVE